MTPEYQKLQLSEIFQHLYRKRKPLLIVTISLTVILTAASFLIPNEYKATANLLPTKNQSIGFNLLGQSGLKSIAGSLIGEKSTQADRFYVLLNSHTINEKVVKHFHLTKEYNTTKSSTPIQAAIKKLSSNTSFESMDQGNFVISVWDKSPKKAKEMADYYVKLLNNLNTKISVKEAREYKGFITKQYLEEKHKLDSLVTVNTQFEKKYGIYNLPDQLSSYIGILGGLTAKKLETEIKLNYMNQSMANNNSTYQQTRNELNAINRKIESLKTKGDPNGFMVRLNSLPNIGQKYYNIQFGLKVHETILKFLMPMYEQAKMEEAKAIPVVTEVDAPYIPKKKAWPHRSLIAIGSLFSVFILMSLYYTLSLAYDKNRDYFAAIFDDKND